MAKKNPPAAPAAATSEAAGTAPVAKAPSGPRGVPQDAIIRMQPDPKSEGKVFGPDHNPKRAGSAGHARFALYEDGMTVKGAIDKGIWAADIKWDMDKGFIKVEGGTAKAAAPAATEIAADPAPVEGAEAEAA